jgi:hypothetical protein
VIEETALLKYMLIKLASSLSKQVATSKFGLGLVSDYDVYFYCSTPSTIQRFLRENNINTSTDKMTAISRNA